MAIIKQYRKDTGVTYVYESESYWDKEKQQPRSRRKLIGKIDPETGEIVPTEPRKRRKTAEKGDTDLASLEALCKRQEKSLEEKDETILELRRQLAELTAENRKKEKLLKKIFDLAGTIQS